MSFFEKEHNEWRGGVFLCTTKGSLQADLLESKLASEGIPVVKRYRGASNAMEIMMGNSLMFPIDLYVPEEKLEDARNIIVPVPLEECEDIDFD